MSVQAHTKTLPTSPTTTSPHQPHPTNSQQRRVLAVNQQAYLVSFHPLLVPPPCDPANMPRRNRTNLFKNKVCSFAEGSHAQKTLTNLGVSWSSLKKLYISPTISRNSRGRFGMTGCFPRAKTGKRSLKKTKRRWSLPRSRS